MKINYRYILTAIIILSLFLNTYKLSERAIWQDEMGSILAAEKPLSQIAAHVVKAESNPPFYYYLLHLWMYFGKSELWLRLLTALTATASVYALFLVGRRLFNTETGLISAFLLTISTYHINASQDVRYYSLTALLALLSTYLFLLILTDSRFKNYLLYFIFSTIGVYTFYFFFLILLVQNIAVFVNYKSYKSILKKWAILQIAVVATFLFWFPNFFQQTFRVIDYFWIPKPALWAFLNSFLIFSSGKVLGILFIALALFSIVTLEFKNGKFRGVTFKYEYREKKLLFLTAYIIIPMTIIFIYSLYGRPLYINRYLILFTPFLYILVAKGIKNLNYWSFKLAMLLIVLILASVSLYSYYSSASSGLKDALLFVEDNYQAGDIITHGSVYSYFPSLYYHENRFTEFILVNEPVPHNLLGGVIESDDVKYNLDFIKDYDRVWLVNHPEENSYAFRRFTDDKATLLGRNQFDDIVVLLYTVKK